MNRKDIKVEIGRVVESQKAKNIIYVEPCATVPWWMPNPCKVGFDGDPLYATLDRYIYIMDCKTGKEVCRGVTDATENQTRYLIDLARGYKNTGSDLGNRRTDEVTDLTFFKRLFPPKYLSLALTVLEKTRWNKKTEKYKDMKFLYRPLIATPVNGTVYKHKPKINDKGWIEAEDYGKIIISERKCNLDDF